MALTKTIKKHIVYCSSDDYAKSNIEKDVTYKNCYIKITSISGDKEKLSINVNFYETADKEEIIDKKNYQFTPLIEDNSDNFIKQGYEYLKTLDEFKDAEDC